MRVVITSMRTKAPIFSDVGIGEVFLSLQHEYHLKVSSIAAIDLGKFYLSSPWGDCTAVKTIIGPISAVICGESGDVVEGRWTANSIKASLFNNVNEQQRNISYALLAKMANFFEAVTEVKT